MMVKGRGDRAMGAHKRKPPKVTFYPRSQPGKKSHWVSNTEGWSSQSVRGGRGGGLAHSHLIRTRKRACIYFISTAVIKYLGKKQVRE